jgi:hypothetical protein
VTRGRGRAEIIGLRLAGGLWIIAGLVCVALFFFVFVGENLDNLAALLQDPLLPSLVAGGAIVGLVIGGLLITRPGPEVVRWSTGAGVAWLILFGSVVLTSLDKPGPRTSSGLITAFGIAGALVAYRSRAAVRRR